MPFKSITGFNAGGKQIVNGADGSAATDFVTLQQLQAMVRGLNWKLAVRVKSTGNITLSAPGATINGVSMVVGDRMLLNNQTTGAENGIYVWNGAAAAATRAPDADSSAEMVGAAVYVTEGTVSPDTMWTQTIDPFTLGTTTPVFTQFGGGGASYLAGNGLSLTSTTFAVVAGTGIIADGSSTRIDTAVVVRKYAANCAATTNPQSFPHGMGSADVEPMIREVSTGAIVGADVTVDTTNIVVDFGGAPTAAQYRILGQG